MAMGARPEDRDMLDIVTEGTYLSFWYNPEECHCDQ